MPSKVLVQIKTTYLSYIYIKDHGVEVLPLLIHVPQGFKSHAIVYIQTHVYKLSSIIDIIERRNY
jgi:hypothetical protein